MIFELTKVNAYSLNGYIDIDHPDFILPRNERCNIVIGLHGQFLYE